MAFFRLWGWAVLALGLGLSAEAAAPVFTMTVTCRPTASIRWRVIAANNWDMVGAVTTGIDSTFDDDWTDYPRTQSGTASVGGSTPLYWRWQIMTGTPVWQDMGPAGYAAPNAEFTGSFTFTPANCLPTGSFNPDLPFTWGNDNPFGGTITPTLPGGTPLPPPSEWPTPPVPPYTGPWPPYVGPGGSFPITININNFDEWDIDSFDEIQLIFTPGPPPSITNYTTVTNITYAITNVNGTNMTIPVTNISVVAGGGGGLPSGGFTPGDSGSGTELLTLAQLETLNAIKGNTTTITNQLGALQQSLTNGPADTDAEGALDGQTGMGWTAGAGLSNQLSLAIGGGTPSLSGSAVPLLTLPDGAGGLATISFDVSGILPELYKLKALLLWAILIGVAVANWKCLEDNLRAIMHVQPATTVGNSVAGTAPHKTIAALAVATAIIAVWTVVTGALMAAGNWGAFTGSTNSLLSSFGYLGWFSNFVPIAEMVVALFSVITFRLVAFKIASAASVAMKYLVGI